LVGLKRRGAPREEIHALRGVFDALFAGEGTLAERAAAVAEGHAQGGLVREVTDFILAGSSRHFCLPG
ncbi:MAG: acyl-[acyl-carrier-protein]--UDP-N-acetylglucosamine O-acyltransferase, partial [Pseudomonadota bacterium]